MKDNYTTESLHTQYITTETHQFLERTINRFRKSKKRTNDFLNYASTLPKNENPLSPNTCEAVNSCGSWLEFRNYFKVETTKLHRANFCKKDKLCPACAMRRASKQVKKVHSFIKSNEDLKSKHWYYIVLPVKHNSSESFQTVFNRLRDGLEKLKRSIQNGRRGQKKGFFTQFEGMLYSLEVTKTNNGWNCHVNLLCCSDKPINGIYWITTKQNKETAVHDQIKEEWSKFTDNNSYVHSINKLNTDTEDDMIKNLLEVFKYALKFQDLSNQDLIEVYRSTYRKRLLGGFGSLYGIKVDVNLDEDDIADQEYLEIIYRYDYKTGNYFHHSTDHREVLSSDLDDAEGGIERKIEKREDLIRKKKPKYLSIEVYDQDGSMVKKEFQPIPKNFTDFEVFSISQKKAPQGIGSTRRVTDP